MPLFIASVIYLLWLCCFVAASYRCNTSWWRTIILAGGLIAGYFVHMICIIGYWELEVSFAANDEELDRVVTSDGASLVFNAVFFAPATSIFGFLIAGTAAFVGTFKSSAYYARNRTQASESMRNRVSRSESVNPYDPND